jgi:Flp pilus assembly protein TadD
VTGGAFLPHYTLAKSLAVEGRFAARPAEARAALSRALELDPGHAGAHQSLGIVTASTGALDDAERHFRTPLALDPALEHGHYNLALVRPGETDAAAPADRPQYENGQTLK